MLYDPRRDKHRRHAEILDCIVTLLSRDEYAWWRGGFYHVNSNNHGVSMCLVGAIEEVTKASERRRIFALLRAALPARLLERIKREGDLTTDRQKLIFFNDKNDTNCEDVLALIGGARAKLPV